MKFSAYLLGIILLCLIFAMQPAFAQEQGPSPTPSEPSNVTYTVVSGDTLFAIAERFSADIDAIIAANNITDVSGFTALSETMDAELVALQTIE